MLEQIHKVWMVNVKLNEEYGHAFSINEDYVQCHNNFYKINEEELKKHDCSYLITHSKYAKNWQWEVEVTIHDMNKMVVTTLLSNYEYRKLIPHWIKKIAKRVTK